MMKEFGVKFDIDSSEFILNMKATGLLLAAGEFEENSMTAFCKALFRRDPIKIAVLPESEALFEARFKDLGIFADRQTAIFNASETWEGYVGDRVYLTPITVAIIMRDGKHFFSPLKEASN